MYNRPLHRVACGLMLVAATATTAVSADKERPKREAPKSSAPAPSNSSKTTQSTPTPPPRKVLPARPETPVVTPRSTGNSQSKFPQLEQFRNQQRQQQQMETKPSTSANATPRKLPQATPPVAIDRTPRGNATGNTGINPNGSQLERRLEQIRGQSPIAKDGSGDNATDQLRQRMQQQLEQQRQAGTKKPDENNDLRDRVKNIKPSDSLRDQVGNQDKLPRPQNPNLTPKLDELRGRIETMKPDLNANTKSETDRLRERFNDGLNNRPGNVNLPNDKDNSPVLGNREGKPALRIEKNGLIRDLDGVKPIVDRGPRNDRIKNADDLQRTFDRIGNTQEVKNVLKNTNLKLNDFSGAFQANIRHGNYKNIAQTNIGKKYNLNQQFNLFMQGDITRQLNLNQQLIAQGGWAKRPIGPVYNNYTSAHFSAWYPGPAWYPSYCWTPIWSPWVSWSFWGHPSVIYDPRPFICRPIYYYDPCPPIVAYQYPVWSPLPTVACGTWVDVPVVSVPSGYDVQLLAVRFVDPGHPEEHLGPRYRVWLRNNSLRPIQSPFNVTLVAANDDNLIAGLPQAGVTVPEMEPDAVIPVDIRLPFEANRMNLTSSGQHAPFATLHVLVDSHGELPEMDETNNGLAIARGEVLPIDPAAFSTDVSTAGRGSLVSLAGEGFGPEPGQIVVIVGDQEYPAEIHGWYDLGVNFQVPNLPMGIEQTAQVLVIRGDGAASNPVAMEVIN
ncbi:hypothetical protein GC163_10960 [bacterium]|nr:hypothetical protein [bacterium]